MENKILQKIQDENNISNIMFSKEEITHIYNMGVKSFKLMDYSTALKFFKIATRFEFVNPMYLKALAGAYQALKDYQNAFINYKLAYSLNTANIAHADCLFYSGVCAYELNELKIAKSDFIAFSKYQEHYLNLANKAELYLNMIAKKIGDSTEDGK